MSFICYNGYLIQQKQLAINTSDEAWRWGHGFFESGRWHQGKWLFAPHHHQRIQHTATVLQFKPLPSPQVLENYVAETIAANQLQAGARIRIQFWPDVQNGLSYCIEATPLSTPAFAWKETGANIAVYKHFIKSADAFSNLKLCSYAPYVQARRWAQAQDVAEAILCNSSGRICEGAHSNIFVLLHDTWMTPPLSEGPVAGVCRSHLLQNASAQGITVKESMVTLADLKNAQEVILTNAVQGMVWVQAFGESRYHNTGAKKLHTALFEPFTL